MTDLSTNSGSLLRRLRRLGLILTGDQTLADGILEAAFLRARPAVQAQRNISPQDIFKLAFDAFDDAIHRKGVVVILTTSRDEDGSLNGRVRSLTYVERVAVALILVEDMSPHDAMVLSGRPSQILENSLNSAIKKLDGIRASGTNGY
ncbi:hypothetical protein [Henriciella litoralis]|uniref:hypothetical protein n=1 Tax=Henriciella litoralis TaxID=568102 RepID=UPI000A03142B|nr:hypothetical protein [Henriciella litoralis]